MQILSLDLVRDAQTLKLVSTLKQAGIEFKFVGGCVRDAVLGKPNNDIDIATSSTPEEIIDKLSMLGIQVIPTGLDHGTVTAIVDGNKFEITTLRKDISTDGRHAVVEFTDDWYEDAKRRDFTMNALYADADGVLTDYFNGAADAKACYVRFIGDPSKRIKEDALRILRFFRFNASLKSAAIDSDGLRACAILAPMLNGLSGERIQGEMLKILSADSATGVIGIMQNYGVLEFVIPAPVRPTGLHELQNLEKAFKGKVDPLLSLTLLLRSLGHKRKPVFEHLIEKWRLSGAQVKKIQSLLNHIDTDLDEAAAKSSIRKLGVETFIDNVLLSSLEDKTDDIKINKLITLARTWDAPKFPINGDDLLAIGFKTGPAFGKALAFLESEWEHSNYTTSKDDLLDILKGI